jgi:hypothetical protein
MLPQYARQWVYIGLTAAIVGTGVHLSARAQTTGGAPSEPPSTVEALKRQQNVRQLRLDIEEASRRIRQREEELNLALYARIKSIYLSRGLTPEQAVAFDKAYEAELAEIDRAKQELQAAQLRLNARENVVQMNPTVPGSDANILVRLDALEARVAALEKAIGR